MKTKDFIQNIFSMPLNTCIHAEEQVCKWVEIIEGVSFCHGVGKENEPVVITANMFCPRVENGSK